MLNGPTWCLWTCWSASWGEWHTGWGPRIRSASYASLDSCRAIPPRARGELAGLEVLVDLSHQALRTHFDGDRFPPMLRRRANWGLWERSSASWYGRLCRSVSSEQTNQVGLAGLLQGHRSPALKAQVSLEVLVDFSHQALVGNLRIHNSIVSYSMGRVLDWFDVSESGN